MNNNEISCEVIQDLIPLYNDDCCSDQTRKIVKNHLAECKECNEMYRSYQGNLPQIDVLDEPDINGIKKGIKSINRWKRRGIVLVCFVLALVFVVLPARNYMAGEGLTYTNLQSVYIAHSFMEALVSGDYEKAYGYLDVESRYEDLVTTNRVESLCGEATEKEVADAKAVDEGIRKIEEYGFNWYNKVCKEKFMENMKTLEEEKEIICSYTDFRIANQPFGWDARFEAQTMNETEFAIHLEVSPDGIRNIGTSVALTADTPQEEAGEKILQLDRLYRFPSINETVLEILYGNIDYDWTRLFQY